MYEQARSVRRRYVARRYAWIIQGLACSQSVLYLFSEGTCSSSGMASTGEAQRRIGVARLRPVGDKLYALAPLSPKMIAIAVRILQTEADALSPTTVVGDYCHV